MSINLITIYLFLSVSIAPINEFVLHLQGEFLGEAMGQTRSFELTITKTLRKSHPILILYHLQNECFWGDYNNFVYKPFFFRITPSNLMIILFRKNQVNEQTQIEMAQTRFLSGVIIFVIFVISVSQGLYAELYEPS